MNLSLATATRLLARPQSRPLYRRHIQRVMSQSSKPQVTKTSICLCKGVELKVTGVDKGAVLCHCSNCQKGSGSAFAHNYRLINANMEVVKGQDLIKEYADSDTKSGNTLVRRFCSNCGSPLYLSNSTVKDVLILHAGLMEGERPQPKFNLFEDNIASWVGDLSSTAKSKSKM